MTISNYLNKVIIGQLLADGYVEKIGINCRLSFSFGTNYQPYALWIYSLFINYCSSGVYDVISKTKGKQFINYRLKTKTFSVFNNYRDEFYILTDNNKYKKIVPTSIIYTICPIVLAHLIIGDGSFNKTDQRIRIYTNHFSFEECDILANSIINNCKINCKVLYDRTSTSGQKQYILTIGKKELIKLQNIVKYHIHDSILYRIGL